MRTLQNKTESKSIRNSPFFRGNNAGGFIGVQAKLNVGKPNDKYETDYNKTYFITVKFQIYDLFQEKIIWNILMYNKAERSETRTTDTGCVESCVSGAINSILFGSPAEISREEVLSEIFNKFAEKLAKQ